MRTGIETPPELAGEFVPVRGQGLRGLVRRGYEDELDRLGATGTPAGVAEVGGGREAHPLVELAGGERVVVRGYRRGGMLRHLNERRYFLPHRAIRELRVTEAARTAGVRAAEVIAAIELPARFGYTAFLATRWLPDAVPLVDAIRSGAPELAAILRDAGRQIGLMHRAGISHPDLNLNNFLVCRSGEEGRPEVVVLDFDRAGAGSAPVAEWRRARELRRLARSARKLGARLGDSGWADLRAGYGSGWPRWLAPA